MCPSSWVAFGILHLIAFPVKILYFTGFIPGCSIEAGDNSGGLARKPLRRVPERFEGCTSYLKLYAKVMFTDQ